MIVSPEFFTSFCCGNQCFLYHISQCSLSKYWALLQWSLPEKPFFRRVVGDSLVVSNSLADPVKVFCASFSKFLGKARETPLSVSSSTNRKKYAGPDPESAVTACISSSCSSSMDPPVAENNDRQNIFSFPLFWREKESSNSAPTSAGVLGMMRQIRFVWDTSWRVVVLVPARTERRRGFFCGGEGKHSGDVGVYGEKNRVTISRIPTWIPSSSERAWHFFCIWIENIGVLGIKTCFFRSAARNSASPIFPAPTQRIFRVIVSFQKSERAYHIFFSFRLVTMEKIFYRWCTESSLRQRLAQSVLHLKSILQTYFLFDWCSRWAARQFFHSWYSSRE